MRYQDVRVFMERAGNDPASLQELQQLSATLANRANTRLTALEQAGYTSNPAYIRAKDYLQTTQGRYNFSRSKRLQGEDLEEQIDELYRFLYGDVPTTISGEKMRRSGIEQQIEGGFLEVPEDMDEDQFKRKMLEFYESDWWNEYKKTFGRIGSPKDVILRVQDAISSGASIRKLNEAFNAYKMGEPDPETSLTTEDFLEVFENWERIS